MEEYCDGSIARVYNTLWFFFFVELFVIIFILTLYPSNLSQAWNKRTKKVEIIIIIIINIMFSFISDKHYEVLISTDSD